MVFNDLQYHKYSQLLFLFSISIQVWAQEQPNRIERKISEGHHINALKEGALLVRLPDRQPVVNALEKAGNTEMVQRIKDILRIRNSKTIAAFRSGFDFCPVYFFYSNDSKAVSRGYFDGKLLNDSLEVDSSLSVESKQFYILDSERVYFDGFGQTAFEGFAILDTSLEQLDPPFPYYVRKSRTLLPFIAKKKPLMVEQLNDKLHTFHLLQNSGIMSIPVTFN